MVLEHDLVACLTPGNYMTSRPLEVGAAARFGHGLDVNFQATTMSSLTIDVKVSLT